MTGRILALAALGVMALCGCVVVGVGLVALTVPQAQERMVGPTFGGPTPSVTSAPAAVATPTASPITATAVPIHTPTTTPEPTETPATAPPSEPPRAAPTLPAPIAAVLCHPSYPDFCLPPPPPVLTCSSPLLRLLPNFRPGFRVLHDVPNPDPHGFDRQRTGRGCVE
ncbi:MAG: hypothetical protein KatS3mg060_3666 [Dehalococcoidia bacterium]|nr:MAG: hypothetical protein KatS3mg060_3666 [Dehalococcoidia bacterium]